VDHYVGWALGVALLVAFEVVVRCKGIENLARVGEVGFECEDACLGVWKVDKIEIQDLLLSIVWLLTPIAGHTLWPLL
jgi:hypothetical protein